MYALTAGPSPRFGGCQIMAESRDSMLVISGAPTPASAPINDMWEYSFVTRTWNRRLLSGHSFRPFLFGGCTTNLTHVYTFGGANADGIRGLMYRIHIATGDVSPVHFSTIPALARTFELENAAFTTVGDALSGLLFVGAGEHMAPSDILCFWIYNVTDPKEKNYNAFTYYRPEWTTCMDP